MKILLLEELKSECIKKRIDTKDERTFDWFYFED